MTYINSTIASTVQSIGKTTTGYLNTPDSDFVTKLKSVANGTDDSTFKNMYPSWIPKLLDLQTFWRAIKVTVVGEKDDNGNLVKKGLRQLNLIGSAVDLKIVYDNNDSFVLLSDSDIDILDAVDQYYTRYLESSERSAGGYKDTTQTTQPQNKATGEPEKKENQAKTEEQEQKRKEEIKKQGETTPGIQDQAHLNNSTTADQPQNFDAAEYVPLLCKYFNQATRSSTKTPQVPVSVLVSIALARTGFDPKKLQHYDFWCLAYDKDISETPNYSEGRCGFESFGSGINGVMKLLQRDKSSYAADLSELKPKMSDSSEDAKKNTIKKILTRLNSATPNSIEEQYKVAIGYIDKYKLFEWDADKTKQKGGHSDDTPTSEDDKTLGKIAQEIGKVFKEYSDKLKGTEFKIESIPQGGDFVLLIKLPKGKCYCEPIYPDLVVVGDSVPSWIYSQEYVEAYAAAEKEVLKAYGLSTAASEEEAALEAANEAIENFKDHQFEAWCIDYGIDYKTKEEKAEALKQYEAAAAKNEYGYFSTDGIYMPDESSKSTYQALQIKRNLALKDSTDAATRYTQAQYNTALKATAQTIQEREGSWNQDTGTYISTATPDTTDIIGSQVTPAGSTATVAAGDSSGVKIDQRVENAVKWAEKIAADDTKGYEYGAAGPDKYDCSGFVWKAFQEGGGFDIPDRSDAAFEKAGFQKIAFPGADKLIRGDKLMRDERHEGIYTGNGQHAASHSANYTQDRQIDISPVGTDWSHIMRFPIPSGPAVVSADLSTLTLIGDSIFNGNRAVLQQYLPTANIIAKGSQQIRWGYEQVLELQKTNKLGSVVVLELGTNAGLAYGNKEYAQKLIDLLGSSRAVYWLTTYLDVSEFMVECNQHINSLPSSHSNIKVIDWYSAASQHPEWIADGVHPTAEGAVEMAKMIKSAIGA